ncbi:MAG: 1-acyl-sn-glycerol-3-phosphate acyltransferase [Gammaproteobacteria bacterium]|nr:1-acyl-sn-glycerol-3-phosphate acyltransferase [Gammaproteobacteria bacterium]MDH5800119.1 1-acyl-sn-glycerol-3-phosphate acyltransferase [Gammaproteobacteria bacterium]
MYIPEPGDNLPRRGNAFSKWLGRSILRLCRWRIEGSFCQSPKFVIVMAPHTSWWDFTNNFGVLLATGLHASWFIANKYTKGIIGTLLGYVGAIPVERSERTDMVTQMANQFHNHDRFLLAIFPEGTRKPVPHWKTGFWHIAKKAQVPVQLVAVDYRKRATVFGPVMELSDNVDADIQHMREYFRPVLAKRPEKALYDN